MMKTVITITVLSLGLGLSAACVGLQGSVAPQEFFRGKTLTYVVSAGTSGGDATDMMTRTIAPYLAKELGATVKVENRESDEGVNYVYQEAKKDGLTLVTKATNALVSNDILKAPGVLYDTAKFNFVADVHPASPMLMISPKLPYKTLDEFRKAKGMKGGGTTAKGMLAVGAAVSIEVLGLDAKAITGFNGKKDLTLAVGRGEIDFMVPTDTSGLRDEADGYVKNFLSLDKKRSPVLPNVPTIYESGVKIPKEMEAALEYMALGGYAVTLPPDVPQDRVDYLRKVFEKISTDPELQKGIEKASGASRPFMPGKELQNTIATIKANTELATQLDNLVKKHSATQ